MERYLVLLLTSVALTACLEGPDRQWDPYFNYPEQMVPTSESACGFRWPGEFLNQSWEVCRSGGSTDELDRRLYADRVEVRDQTSLIAALAKGISKYRYIDVIGDITVNQVVKVETNSVLGGTGSLVFEGQGQLSIIGINKGTKCFNSQKNTQIGTSLRITIRTKDLNLITDNHAHVAVEGFPKGKVNVVHGTNDIVIFSGVYLEFTKLSWYGTIVLNSKVVGGSPEDVEYGFLGINSYLPNVGYGCMDSFTIYHAGVPESSGQQYCDSWRDFQAIWATCGSTDSTVGGGQ
jgi:hypothetical protein